MRPPILLAVILVIAIPWQTRWGLYGDTSWLITICERLLGGDRLYVDVIETNPPFSVWLYMPAVYFANILGMAPEYLVQAYVYAACFLGLGFAGFIARRAGLREYPALHALSPAFLALLIIFPGNSFSEREHFGVALILPLLALMIWRASTERLSEPELWVAVLAGLAGSVIVLVKPYYAVVILAPALYVAWRNRSIRSLFAIEYWTIGLVNVAYLGCVLRFYPEFISQIYPILADTYLQLKSYKAPISNFGGAYLALLCVLRILRPGVPASPLVTVLVIASLAAIVPLVYQGKGWTYHAYPAIALMAMALLCRLIRADGVSRPSDIGWLPKVFLSLAILTNFRPFLISEKPDAELVTAIRDVTESPSVGIVGSGIEIGHPLTRMVDGRWISAYCSDWLGSAAAALSMMERASNDIVDAERHEAIERDYIDFKVREFVAAKPDLIFVQRADDLWNRRVFARQAFSHLMQDYRFLAEDNSTRVYLRNGSEKSASND